MIPVRYRILCIYSAMLAMTQYQWMRFAPITDLVSTSYGISYGQVGSLSLAVTALSLPLALPSGSLIDRISVRACLRATAVAMLLAALIRIGQPRYGCLLAGQLLFGFVQPLTMSLLVKLMLTWFPAPERGRVSALSSMVIFLGIGAAFVLVPLTAPGNVAGSLRWDAGLLALIAALTFACVPRDPALGDGAAPAGHGARSLRVDGVDLLRTRPFIAVLLMIFLTNGYFSAITTWLEPILLRQGVDTRTSGWIVVLMLAAGMASSALIVALVRAGATVGRVLSCAALCAGVGTLCLFTTGSLPLLALAGVAIGAALLSPLPLLLQLVSDAAGHARSGTATAIFWLAGNIGATLMIAALGRVVDHGDWGAAAWLLCLALLAQIAISLTGFRPGRLGVGKA
ncbi:MFS transporter [Chromobacterium sp. ATCC 53434]|uniref:MFS transporter n=1 Tax=Chromobacterium sp. (strain ATCC 53434 / SC 14030) TaxID=2059672 RepID=UPI001F472EC9|nr:MFS transporter [Chromobacterium sp. ATCC 53434]